MQNQRRLLVTALVTAACAKPPLAEPPPPEPATAEPSPCPARDGLTQLLPPGATPIAGRGMATTINPGMNTSEEHYRIETMSAREAKDFYRRCLRPSDDMSSTFAEPVQGGDAGPGATRSYEVRSEAGATVVRVRCTRCY